MTAPPIIPANTAIQTFRDNGYKNTASAISELIDNSIDAKAKNIEIHVDSNHETKIIISDDLERTTSLPSSVVTNDVLSKRILPSKGASIFDCSAPRWAAPPI